MPGPPQPFQKSFSTVYHFHIALQGPPRPCYGPAFGPPSHLLRAWRTLSTRIFDLAEHAVALHPRCIRDCLPQPDAAAVSCRTLGWFER